MSTVSSEHSKKSEKKKLNDESVKSKWRMLKYDLSFSRISEQL